jgi:hypothetical protein
MSAKLLDTAKIIGRSSVLMMAGVLGVKSVLDLIAAAASDPFDRCKPLESELTVLRHQHDVLGDRLKQGPHDPRPGKPDSALEEEYQKLNRAIEAKERELEACRKDIEPVSNVVADEIGIWTGEIF